MTSDNPLFDLKSLTEPVSKLIETIGNGIGIVYEPTRIRRKAKAEAEALQILADGSSKAAEVTWRAQTRLDYLELRRQKNIEAIVKSSSLHLPEKVSSQPVDEDWIVGFFGQCQDVGDIDMQSLWAKLLAGEVATPGSFSKRTLSTVRLMDKCDADLFTKFATYVWRVGRRCGHLDTYEARQRFRELNLREPELLHLHSIGLLGEPYPTEIPIPEGEHIWRYHSRSFRVVATYETHLPGHLLSQVGCELLSISGAKEDREYLESVAHAEGAHMAWRESIEEIMTGA